MGVYVCTNSDIYSPKKTDVGYLRDDIVLFIANISARIYNCTGIASFGKTICCMDGICCINSNGACLKGVYLHIFFFLKFLFLPFSFNHSRSKIVLLVEGTINNM
jgi:hypothetical protein